MNNIEGDGDKRQSPFSTAETQQGFISENSDVLKPNTANSRPLRIFILKCVLILVGFLAIWALDTSVTCILNGLVMFNGLWYVAPELMYHISIVIIMMVFTILLFIGVSEYGKQNK
jgi:hypothetical protein